MNDQADCHGHHAGAVSNRVGILHLIAVFDVIALWSGVRNAACAAVDHVDAVLLERARERYAVLDRPTDLVHGGYTQKKRLLLRPMAAHAAYDLDHEPHAILERAAVSVGALVR